jgi:transcriptional regulator with PAS, ATPase and Fis domain
MSESTLADRPAGLVAPNNSVARKQDRPGPSVRQALLSCGAATATVRAALEQAKGNKLHAAKALGISRRSLYRMIEKYNLEDGRVGHEA